MTRTPPELRSPDQFSDVHFGVEHRRACAAALDYAHATPNDLILITGDVTQKGLPDEFAAAGAWIRAMPEPRFVSRRQSRRPLLQRHGPAVLAVEGVRGGDRLSGPRRRVQAGQSDGARRDHRRGWQARLNWSKGVIDLDQTRRAAAALRQAPVGALRILACHHPLIEMIGTPMTGDVKRGDAAAGIFAEAGVDLIMTGHTHIPFALPIDLTDRCSYAVGCGTLSHRERGRRPASTSWTGTRARSWSRPWPGTARRSHRAGPWRLPRRQDTRHPETAPDPVVAGEKEKAAVLTATPSGPVRARRSARRPARTKKPPPFRTAAFSLPSAEAPAYIRVPRPRRPPMMSDARNSTTAMIATNLAILEGHAGDAAEAQNSGDQRHDEEDDSPTKHSDLQLRKRLKRLINLGAT
jgi:predicted phosphodiesterase